MGDGPPTGDAVGSVSGVVVGDSLVTATMDVSRQNPHACVFSSKSVPGFTSYFAFAVPSTACFTEHQSDVLVRPSFGSFNPALFHPTGGSESPLTQPVNGPDTFPSASSYVQSSSHAIGVSWNAPSARKSPAGSDNGVGASVAPLEGEGASVAEELLPDPPTERQYPHVVGLFFRSWILLPAPLFLFCLNEHHRDLSVRASRGSTSSRLSCPNGGNSVIDRQPSASAIWTSSPTR